MEKGNGKKALAIGAAVTAALGAVAAGFAFWMKKNKDQPSDEVYYESFDTPKESSAPDVEDAPKESELNEEIKEVLEDMSAVPEAEHEIAETSAEENEEILNELAEKEAFDNTIKKTLMSDDEQN